MGRRRVTVDQLAGAIEDILKQYEDNIEEGLEPVLRKTAQTARAEVKANSPKRTGDYKKGWQYSQDGLHFSVYNGTKPQLTHLLENGHAKRDGGRVEGHPHIAPVEEKIQEQLPEEVIEAIEEAGRKVNIKR